MMEGEDAADHHARASQQLYEGFKEILESDVPMSDEMNAAVKFEGFKEILESDVPMSDEMHAAVKVGMNHHKPPNV